MRLPTIRECIGAVVIFFIVYAVLNDPAQAGDTAGDLWGHLKDGFGAVTTFFDSLIDN